MTLIAMRPILYLAHQYRAGDKLPTSDQRMVALWVDAGSAIWKEDTATVKRSAKARPAAAKDGAIGISSDGREDSLVGRIPESEERKGDAPKRTRRKKTQ